MPAVDYSFAAVFFAGVVSFFSPCVLPLLPAYAALIFGQHSGGRGLINALAFLSGFCLIFVGMGAAVGAMADFLWTYQVWLRKAGALLIGLMGLYLLGVLQVKFLNQEHRPLLKQSFNGPLGAFALGMALTIGWTPCVSPILTGVLAYAGSTATASKGALLLLIYALGFCLPLLIFGALIGRYLPKFQRLYRYLPLVQKVCGVVMLVVAVALYFDKLRLLAGS